MFIRFHKKVCMSNIRAFLDVNEKQTHKSALPFSLNDSMKIVVPVLHISGIRRIFVATFAFNTFV